MKRNFWMLGLITILFVWSVQAYCQPNKDFKSYKIPDSVFVRMQGNSYGPGCPVSRDDLRLLRLLHVDAEGRTKVGELVCHKDIAADLLQIFQQLYKARYPIERIRLVDDYGASDNRSMRANNTSAFNYRRIAGSKRLSNHSYGMAVDINPLYNPCVSGNGKCVQPVEGKAYVNRSRSFKYKIDRGDLCYRLFKKHGFIWGGDWRSLKDYQHFEKKRR